MDTDKLFHTTRMHSLLQGNTCDNSSLNVSFSEPVPRSLPISIPGASTTTQNKQCDAMPQPSFPQMPLHLISLVLSELDSIQSLGSAILSHSSMYAAFNENPKTIMFRILLNQIPPNLMTYAAITHEASKDENRTNRRLKRLFSTSLDRSDSHTPEFQEWYLWWRLNHQNSGPAFASSLSKTHLLVKHFTRRFLSDTLPLADRDLFGECQHNTKPPSRREIYRIRRAFYRFQLYCNIINNNPEPLEGPIHRAHLFFKYFSPWVNEQLACIHDYLEGILSKGAHPVMQTRSC